MSPFPLPTLLTAVLAWMTLVSPASASYLVGRPAMDPSRFAIAAKYNGLTYHPDGGENEERYKRSLDSRDFWVVQVGLEGDVDYALRDFLLFRFGSALYRDCADVWAGFFHLGFRLQWDPMDRLALRIGIGPTYLWRQNWLNRVKGYTKDSFFGDATKGPFQDAFIWYGGDIDVEWRAWRRVSLVYSMIPGYPEVIQSSAGVRMSF